MSQSGRAGKFLPGSVAGESYHTFIPQPLPPNPPLQLSGEDYDLIEKANRAMGRLDGLSRLLPDTDLFIYFYVRKEAVLSSQIEGTQSSFTDLLLFELDEAPGIPLDDVREVSRYVAAIDYGLKRISEGFPLSLRLVKELHAILLADGRGSSKSPGEFRRSQNWIGGTRPGNAAFVPPPPELVMECLGELEKFWHDIPSRQPSLFKAALSHVQFETIHPFLDGNGRLGRLLITLLLCAEGALHQPTLYLSLYFKTHRAIYYELLQKVRTEGDWESWLRFFLTGALETAEQAVETAKIILQLFEADRRQIETLGRAASSALRIHQLLQTNPLLSIPNAARQTSISVPTVTSALKHLQNLGLVRELTSRSRNRLFAYDKYIKLLDQGTEPLR